MNNVCLTGRLTKNPDLRYTSSNLAYATFTLAVDGGVSRNTGEKLVDFISCIAWGKRGEFIRDWFERGMKMELSGRLSSRSWDDDSGKRHWMMQVTVESCSFGESKRAREAMRNSADMQNGFTEITEDDREVPFA